MLSGPIPTPAVAYLTTSMRADAGVVISASHNPFGDNGIKIFGPDGFKLVDEKELEIERLLEGDRLDLKSPTGNARRQGRAPRRRGGRYVVYCKSTFPASRTLDGVRVVVDAASRRRLPRGACGLRRARRRRHAPSDAGPTGATSTATLARCTPSTWSTKSGTATRRSASRSTATPTASIVVDEKGQIVDGDVIMALCATRMMRAERLAKKTLVTTVMSNLGLERAIERAAASWCAPRSAIATSSKRCAPAATTSAASSPGTWSFSSTPRPVYGLEGRRSIRDFHRAVGAVLWDDVGMSRTDAGLTHALGKIRDASRGVLAGRLGTRAEKRHEPGARTRRPRRGLPGARASCWRSTRCTAPSLRGFPRGEPDAGRRGAARRRALLLCGRVGVRRRRSTAYAAPGTAHLGERETVTAEL